MGRQPRMRYPCNAAGASPVMRGSPDIEAWSVELYPGRFRSDEARIKVPGRTAGILVDLEAAIRRELGAGRIPP